MNVDKSLLAEIRCLNLSYLLLIKKMAYKDDKDLCLIRLGITSEVFDELKNLSSEEILLISEVNQLIFKFRFDNPKQIESIIKKSRLKEIKNIHTSILLIGQLHNRDKK